MADEIVRQALEQSISLLKNCMTQLRRIPKKKLQKFQEEDLRECEESLQALEKTLAYYSPASE
jgi:NADH:ubiquinone oxidoreductase subunit D